MGDKMLLEIELNIFNYTASFVNCEVLLDSMRFEIVKDSLLTSTGNQLHMKKLNERSLEIRRFSTLPDPHSLAKKMDFKCDVELTACIASSDTIGKWYSGFTAGKCFN